jgi:phosphomannomutase
MLSAVIRGALAALGRAVIDADVAATPTVGILVREHGAAGGVQISASHNPPAYNGIKLFSAEGRVIPAGLGQRVLERYRQSSPAWVPFDQVGSIQSLPNTTSAHVALVTATVNLERIRQRRFRVLLDANHGAGSLVGKQLLEHLGCEVVILGAEPNGLFAHTPEPTAENLATVLASVPAEKAQIGFCQDPDADRLAIIDESGTYLGEEYTLALCVDHELRRRKGPIVTNCSTSRMSQDLAEKHGVPFYRSAVGEANVVDCMMQHNAVLGGEGNGGAIDPRVGWVRDSFAGMALVLDAMASRDLPISQLASELPRYEIVKTKIELAPEKIAPGLQALKQHFADAQADTLDGLRLDWPDKWLLVRASNTEPIVRAIAEAPTQAAAQQLCDQAALVLSAI